MTTQTPEPRRLPQQGSREYDVFVAPIEMAIQAPLRQNETAFAAKIPWPVIHELRQVLEALGIDWRKAREADQARRRECTRGQQP